MNTPEPLYTYQDLAGILKCSTMTVYRLFRHRKKLTPTKRTVRITATEFNKWQKENNEARKN